MQRRRLRVVVGAEGRGVTTANYYSPGDPNERLIRSAVSKVKYLSNIFAMVVQILVFFSFVSSEPLSFVTEFQGIVRNTSADVSLTPVFLLPYIRIYIDTK